MNHNNRPEFDAKDLLAMLRDKTPNSNTREVTVMIRYVNEVLALASRFPAFEKALSERVAELGATSMDIQP